MGRGSDGDLDTSEVQKMMRQIYYERDRERGIERTMLRMFQELGELSEVIMERAARDKIESEFADTFAWLCSLANLLEVDLSSALLSKYQNVCSRCKSSPCRCIDTP